MARKARKREVSRGSRTRGSIVRRSRFTPRGGTPSVKLRAAVPVAFGLLILISVSAFADTKPMSGAPATAKTAPATPKPAASKPASSKSTGTTAKTAEAAPVDSLARLEKMVAKDSSNFDNLYQLGVMYLDKERTPEAQHVLTKAVSIRPKDVKAL